jgi:hypothetical protein
MTDAAYGGAVGRSLQKKSPPAWPETIPCGRIVIPRTCARGIPPVRVDQKVDPGFRDDGVGDGGSRSQRSGWRSAQSAC